jgi:hypothetical protein
MASPQDVFRTNVSRFKPYVTDLIKAHLNDGRVLWWGIYNEPNMRDGFTMALRHAAFGWATALSPSQPVISCWDGANNDTELQNIHDYDTNFGSLTDRAWQVRSP